MNKEDFITEYQKFLKQTGLNGEDVRVNSGGALVMMGLRKETSDVDVELEVSVFERLAVEHNLQIVVLEQPYSRYIAWNSLVDIHAVDNTAPSVLIEDVWCALPIDILKLKKSLNREKDQADIEILEWFIGQFSPIT